MINEEELDILEILLPHHLHAETTILAAEKKVRGISVQKPMALSLSEADAMINACKKSGSILSIYENFVFAPHIMKAKDLLKKDYIGDVASIRIKVAMKHPITILFFILMILSLIGYKYYVTYYSTNYENCFLVYHFVFKRTIVHAYSDA